MSTIEPVQSGLCLRVLKGAHQRPVHALTRSVVSVGRATAENPYSPSYLTFPEPTLSRLHAVLTWEPGANAFMLHHRSQTNPTLLNGKSVTGSQLLNEGDIIALGRLALRVEKNESLEMESDDSEEIRKLCLHAAVKGAEASDIISSPIRTRRVAITFSSDKTTQSYTSSDQSGEPVQQIVLPAGKQGELWLQVDDSDNRALVESFQEDPTSVRRRTYLPDGVLEVPLRSGASDIITEKDILLHQDYRIWLARDGAANPGERTLGSTTEQLDRDKAEPPYRELHFLNGGWSGGVFRLKQQTNTVLDLGPRSHSFHHRSPLVHAPTCRISVKNGVAQLRVQEMSEKQFVDVHGELLFIGESCPLVSGTKILLGEHEFYWVDPELHKEYTRFQLRGPDGVYPITREESRIGTAAHCELRVKHRSLAPVVGVLKFSSRGFVYEHRNLAGPARVDDKETSEGLETRLKIGSELRLSPDVTLVLEEQSC